MALTFAVEVLSGRWEMYGEMQGECFKLTSACVRAERQEVSACAEWRHSGNWRDHGPQGSS